MAHFCGTFGNQRIFFTGGIARYRSWTDMDAEISQLPQMVLPIFARTEIKRYNYFFFWISASGACVSCFHGCGGWLIGLLSGLMLMSGVLDDEKRLTAVGSCFD
jgi:hypothetical protein